MRLAVAGVLGLALVFGVAAERLSFPSAYLGAVSAILVVTAAIGYGCLVLRALSAWLVLDRERWIWAALVGLGVVGTAMELASAAHVFNATTASVVVAVGIGAFLLHVREALVDVADPIEKPGVLWLCALAPAAFVVVWRAQLPPTFYDALVYHLGLPMQFAARGALVVDVHDVYTAFPLLAEMCASPALLLGGVDGFSFVYACEWFLLVAAVFVTARRVFGALEHVGGACAFVVGTMPLVVFLPAGTKPDLFTALCALCVVRVLARLVDDDGPNRVALLRIGALVTGFGCAAKTTFLAWAALIAVVALALEWRNKRVNARECVLAIALVVVAGAFPYVRNAIAIGAPFYPFAGGPAFAEHTRELLNADAHRPHSIVDVLLVPWSISVETDPTADEIVGVTWWIGLLALLAIPAAIKRNGRVVVVVVVALLSLPIWLFTHALPRYDPFLWLALALVSGAGLASARGRMSVVVVVAAVSAAFTQLTWNLAADDVLLRNATPVLVQRDMRSQLLRRALETKPAFDWLNTNAKNGCTLLATGDPRIAYLEAPAIMSEVYARPWLDEIVSNASSVDDVIARLRSLGVTHVLLSQRTLQTWRKHGWGAFDAAALARFQALPRALGPPLFDNDDTGIFFVPGSDPARTKACAP